jgi:hypothetical protein
MNLDPTVLLAVKAQVKGATTRGPGGGPYKKQSTRKEGPFICGGDKPDGRVKVDGYIAIIPGILIKEKWLEVLDLAKWCAK